MGLTLKSHLETWLWLMRKPGTAFVACDKGQRSCPGRPVNLLGSLCLHWASGRGHAAHFVGHTSNGEAKALLAVETPGIGEVVTSTLSAIHLLRIGHSQPNRKEQALS